MTPRFRIPVAAALVGGLSLLVVAAVGSVLWLSYASASSSTLDLLRDRAENGLELLESQVRGQLDPVQRAANGLLEMFSEGALDPNDAASVHAAFRGALSAIPQASAIVLITTDIGVTHVGRGDTTQDEIVAAGQALVSQAGMAGTDTHEGMATAVAHAATMAAAEWLPPLWVESAAQPALTLEAPVTAGGKYAGALFVVVQLGSLVEFLTKLEQQDNEHAFLLYDTENVLAHPHLLDVALMVQGQAVPLPVTQSFGDPALAGLRGAAPSAIDPGMDRSRGFSSVTVGDQVVMLRELAGYTRAPWQLGLTFAAADVNRPLADLRTTAGIGIAILAAAALAALLMGRAFAARIAAMSAVARKLARLDVAAVPEQADSRITEFAEAADAFNQMTAGLRWFETYVPKSLVLRLMSHAREVTRSQERTLTVMFTDIRGFSTLSQRLSAPDIATMLNRHFEVVSACIEAEGGTVDKFIGDSVMAFWGAPEAVPDHAARALRAGRAIAAAVKADNQRRRDAGEEPLFVRVGLHTGPVVVGNIGSKSRVNYTVVGDTVNAASRLESLAKDIRELKDSDADECTVLFSDATAEGLGAAFAMRSLGPHVLRGRAGTTEVFQLEAA